MPLPPAAPSRRLELTLRKPWLGWFPRPTVVFDGRGQPAQWGTGTWQIPAEERATVAIFLFNRLWKFGAAEAVLDPSDPAALVYTAPWLPFLPGSFANGAHKVVQPGSDEPETTVRERNGPTPQPHQTDGIPDATVG